MDCSPPGSSVHGILQVRILEWVVIPFSRGSFWPRDRTCVSCIASRFFTIWATREAPHSWVTRPVSPHHLPKLTQLGYDLNQTWLQVWFQSLDSHPDPPFFFFQMKTVKCLEKLTYSDHLNGYHLVSAFSHLAHVCFLSFCDECTPFQRNAF